jgi:hypothetical protein
MLTPPGKPPWIVASRLYTRVLEPNPVTEGCLTECHGLSHPSSTSRVCTCAATHVPWDETMR